MSEMQFKATLNPQAIVNNRASVGGPQPAEMARMLKAANQQWAANDAWVKAQRGHIDAALARLDSDFVKLLATGR
jgi:argininosuccinate lyase